MAYLSVMLCNSGRGLRQSGSKVRRTLMRIRTLLAGSAVLAVMAGCAAGPTDGTAPGMAADGEVAYQGTLPCRNCAGIDIGVRMMGDEQSAAEERTFALEASYREHPQNPPNENYTGNWEVLSGSADDPA